MKQLITLRSLLVISCLLLGLDLHAEALFIHVETPGTLSSYIASNQKDQITSLTLTGDLNGTDIRYLREMAGCDVNGDATSGQLSILDLSDANIVAGGDYYYRSSYSADNTIGRNMFYHCDQLTDITIPNSVTSIGDLAFWSCIGLSSITIPGSVTSIGESVFDFCSGLTEILVSEENRSYCSVDGVLFSKNKSTLISYPNSKSNSYIIPNSVTSIGNNAFCGCSGLTSITIPNSVISIGEQTFYSCSELTSIMIPNSVTSIGKHAFVNCFKLTSFTIPNSIASIDDGTFSGCIGLTSVTIPNSVTSIGRNAFFSCIELKSITIPNSVISIGDGIFYYCSALTEIHNNSTTPQNIVDSAENGGYPPT